MDSLLNIMVALSGGLFTALCAIIGWVGSRILVKQDEIMMKLDDVKDDLHGRINEIDIRLTIVETKVEQIE